MKEINQIFTEIDGRHLSTIQEIETGLYLSSFEFKNIIKKRLLNLKENFQLILGQCVILQKSNNISFFVDFLALYFLGITIVPVDPETSAADLELLINSVKPALLINETDTFIKGGICSESFKDIALILFTSGSTSKPKGVMLSRVALERKFKLLESKIGLENVKNTLCFVPTYFGHGLICNSLFPLFLGENFFIAKKLDIKLAENLSLILENHNINFFSSVPSHWELITKFGKSYKGQSLKRVHCASSLLKASKISVILKWLGPGIKLFDVYGATEMSGWFACREITNDNSQGHFSDFWDLEYETGSDGELVLKSNYMFDAYWENGVMNRQFKFNSGDIFHNSQLSGRTKNVININGIKVHTEDIVADLLKSQLLEDAAAFPISDNFSGERVGAAVVLKPNSTLEDVWDYCRQFMSPVKIPGEILILNKIPVNNRGKISTNDLISTFQFQKNDESKMLELFNTLFKTNYLSSHISRSNVPDWDSMRHAELIIKIQDIVKIKFAVKDILHIENFHELVNIVIKKRLG